MIRSLLLASVMTLALTGIVHGGNPGKPNMDEERPLYEEELDELVCTRNFCITDEGVVREELTSEEQKQLANLKTQKLRIELKMVEIIANAGNRILAKEPKK